MTRLPCRSFRAKAGSMSALARELDCHVTYERATTGMHAKAERCVVVHATTVRRSRGLGLARRTLLRLAEPRSDSP